jgi:phosphoglycerate dehydrogenase-like enzyme
MKIYITLPSGSVRDTFITPLALRTLRELGEVDLNPLDRQLTPQELNQALRDVEVVVTGWGTPRFDSDLLAGLDALRIIAHTGGTVAPLVSDAVYARGIRVLSGNAIFAASVAEACICYALVSLRQLEHYMRRMRQGGWVAEGDTSRGLIGKTVGLVGYGAVGSRFREMLRPFKTPVKVFANNLTPADAAQLDVSLASLDEIFSTCDVISLHLPLNPATTGMIGSELLAKIRPGALFMNTARGAVVDEAALVEELQTGRFFAALDVFTTEPLPVDSPLRTIPNVLLVPHMAGPTVDMREVVTCELAKDIRAVLDCAQAQIPSEISQDYAAGMTR